MYLWWIIPCLPSHATCSFSPASSPGPGSPAAERAAPEPSNGPSSARCCSPSRRLLLTCPMTSARGSNLLQVSPATVPPAPVLWAKEQKAKKRGRHRRERNCTTGSTRGSQSARRVVGEVRVIIDISNVQIGKSKWNNTTLVYSDNTVKVFPVGIPSPLRQSHYIWPLCRIITRDNEQQ